MKRKTQTDTDPHFKTIITFKYFGHQLKFRVAQSLFSSAGIDIGSAQLLRSLHDVSAGKILDLGCGYGTIGLTLAAVDPSRTVHLVDRDALAVEYSRQNAMLNGLNVHTYGSLGFDDVRERDFDLIVCNIPGKAGENFITDLLKQSQYWLKSGGIVAVVVVAPLIPLVKQQLSLIDGALIVKQTSTPRYGVFHYRFNTPAPVNRPAGSLKRGVYDRGPHTFDHHGLHYQLRTAQGVPEFDTLNWQTELIFDSVAKLKQQHTRRALVLNPGQGHIPLGLARLRQPSHMTLIDRDLLSLRYSQLNLTSAGYDRDISLCHRVDLSPAAPQSDLVIVSLSHGDPPAVIEHLAGQAIANLSPAGWLLIAGSSTAITRLMAYVKSLPITIPHRQREHGHSLLIIQSQA